MALPININDLLAAKTVESDRIEFKEGWNPNAIYRSICAFANDFDNTGGGYILVGVAEENGAAKRPVLGLSTFEISEIQRKMIGFNNLINPPYHPKLFIETVDKKKIIVLWIPGGSNRPYEVPEEVTASVKKNFNFIRRYANSVKPNLKERQELIMLANQVPFDDRVNTNASVNDISMVLIQDHLRKTGSKLADEVGKKSNSEILQQMELVSGPAEHEFPRNVALMLFSEHPEKHFPYTQIELVHFPEGTAGKEFTEKIVKGPVQTQITQALNYIKSTFLVEKVIKVSGKAEANRIWNYPFAAIEEAIANCIYHRNYQEREPVKIRIERGEITLHNAGGPDRSIRREDFAKGKVIPKRYRNRRLGDFLKELELTEGHATGCSTIKQVMKANGSPDPVFDFDEDRTWFQVTLPVHPVFKTNKVAKVEKEVDLSKDIQSINESLDKVLKKAGTKLRDIVGDNAGDIADAIGSAKAGAIDNAIAGAIAGAIVNAIAGAIDDAVDKYLSARAIVILKKCKKPVDRATLMAHLKITNHRKNYEEHVKPLVDLGWLAMTIPGKPTSPKQKYYTTLRGYALLAILEKNKQIKK
ncbi:MAG: putative transcriptional regulator [Bacteroidetes bacterium]|nr:putative transcriptional regulator [Bacteroidota bacterium]